MHGRCPSLLLALLVFFAAPAVRASDARQLYDAGLKHYNLAEYREALASFKEAYRLRTDPVFLFNIAQCYRQLGEYGQAATFYRSYKREGGADRGNLDRLIAEMDRAAAEHKTKAAEPEPQAPATPPPVATAPAPTPVTPPPAAAPTRTPLKLWIGVGVGAAGLVLVGVGAGLFATGAAAFDRLDKPKAGYIFNQDDADRAHNWRPAGAVLIGVGGAMAVAGATLAVLGVRERRHVSVAPTASRDLVGAVVQGSF